MIKHTKILLTTQLLTGILFIHGCAAPEPTRGDLMMNQGPSMIEVGVKWNEGSTMVKQGNKMILEGRDNIKEGNKLAAKGKLQVDEGNRLIQQGKRLISESEAQYQNKPATGSPVAPPEESFEAFPLSD